MSFSGLHQLTVETRNMSYPRRSLLKMALEIGDVRLRELGINVHVVVYEHVTCPDGEIFDGFVWTEEISLEEGPEGLHFTLLSTSHEPSLQAAQERLGIESSPVKV